MSSICDAARFSRASGKDFVKPAVGQHSQHFRQHAHLPGDHAVAGTGFYGTKRLGGELVGLHQERHAVSVLLRQGGVDIARAEGHHLDAGATQVAPQALTKTDHGGLARTVCAMTGKAPNTVNAADSDQDTRAARDHGAQKGVESRGRAGIVDGESSGDDLDILALRRIHTNADSCAGDHNIGQTLTR